MKKTVWFLSLTLMLLFSLLFGLQIINLAKPGIAIAKVEVSAQVSEQEVVHKEITIAPDGKFIEKYLFRNGTYVHNENPIVPISKNIFGNRYTFTGDLYGHLVIERDNIVVDGAGYKLQLQGYGSFAISAGIRDRAHSPTEFVGTNNVVINNIVIEDFGYGIELGGSNNEVSKVTFTGGERGGKAIWASGENNVIRDCRFFKNDGSAIYVSGNGIAISNNYFADNVYGIEFPSSEFTLRRNTFLNNGQAFNFNSLPSTSDAIDTSNMIDGKPVYCWVNEHNKTVPSEAGYVLLNNCTNITVQGISILNSTDDMAQNSNGINLYSTKDSQIRRNYLERGVGVKTAGSCKNVSITENYFGNGGLSLTLSSNISVTSNSFRNNGISLFSSNENLISNNTFSSCTTALNFYGSHYTIIQRNNIKNCDTGVAILSSNENIYNYNNFVNNKQDIREQHTTLEWPFDKYYESVNNNWDGNFWSNYSGKDANRDGVGDTPYVIYEDKKDSFPLISVVDIPELILEPTNSSSTSEGTDGASAPFLLWKSVAVAVTVVVVVVAAAGLLVYFKKRHPKSGAKP